MKNLAVYIFATITIVGAYIIHNTKTQTSNDNHIHVNIANKKTISIDNILTNSSASLRYNTLPISSKKLTEKNIQEETSTNHSTDEKNDKDYAEKIDRLNEAFSKWVQHSTLLKPNFNLSDELKTKFAKEPIDINWAADHEQTLMTLLEKQDSLKGIAVKDIKCKSSTCSISFSATDIEQSNTVLNTLSLALFGINEPSLGIVAPDLSHNTTTIYIARDEKNFDFDAMQ